MQQVHAREHAGQCPQDPVSWDWEIEHIPRFLPLTASVSPPPVHILPGGWVALGGPRHGSPPLYLVFLLPRAAHGGKFKHYHSLWEPQGEGHCRGSSNAGTCGPDPDPTLPCISSGCSPPPEGLSLPPCHPTCTSRANVVLHMVVGCWQRWLGALSLVLLGPESGSAWACSVLSFSSSCMVSICLFPLSQYVCFSGH